MRWTVHHLELGRTAVDARIDERTQPHLRLEVYDGGGFTPSHGVWRVGARAVGIVEAAQA